MGEHYTFVGEKRDSPHYSIMRANHDLAEDGLRKMFPQGEADDMNFVLFSTSGVHGTYTTIEEAHASIGKPDESTNVAFLIVQPRLVCLRYGTVEVTNENVEFLKKLRSSSHAIAAQIGL